MRTIPLLLVTLSTLALLGCKQEPTIVIKFEPNDLAGAAAKALMADGGAAAPAGALGKAAPAPAPAPAPSTDCKVATDCVAINEDCCGCTAGGKQIAIAASGAQTHAQGLVKKCQDSMCAQVMSNDPSCHMAPDCVVGKCVLVAPKGKAGKPHEGAGKKKGKK